MINKLKTIKFIDIFSYIFCAIYFLFVLFFAGIEVFNTMQSEKNLQNLQAYVNNINKNVENSNFYKDNNKEEEISSEPLFKDGKTALITSYTNLMTANSFYSEVTGNMITNTMGIDINVLTYTKCVKYSNDKIYESRSTHLFQTNATDILLPMIEGISNRGTKLLKNCNNITVYKTSKTYINNNGSYADFTDIVPYNDNNHKIFIENLYEINENSILSITFFKVNYKNGIPINYFVQAELDTNLACQKYSVILGENANSVENPKFSKTIISAIIDAHGNISGLTTTDTCTFKMSTPIGIKECPCKLTQKYAISGINDTMIYFDEDFK